MPVRYLLSFPIAGGEAVSSPTLSSNVHSPEGR